MCVNQLLGFFPFFHVSGVVICLESGFVIPSLDTIYFPREQVNKESQQTNVLSLWGRGPRKIASWLKPNFAHRESERQAGHARFAIRKGISGRISARYGFCSFVACCQVFLFLLRLSCSHTNPALPLRHDGDERLSHASPADADQLFARS